MVEAGILACEAAQATLPLRSKAIKTLNCWSEMSIVLKNKSINKSIRPLIVLI
jgi:hypothetical protein